MNYNILISVGAIVIVALFILNNFLKSVSEHGTVESMEKSIKDLEKSESLAKVGLKPSAGEVLSDIAKIEAKIKADPTIGNIQLTYKEVQDKGNRIQEIYLMDQKSMVDHLDEIRNHQKEIVSWKREHGITITSLEETDPEYAMALSTLLDKRIEEAVEVDRIALGLDSQDWYFIKTFSESGDVAKLMRQGKLDNNYVNIENLALVYSNNGQVILNPNKEPAPPIETNFPDADDEN